MLSLEIVKYCAEEVERQQDCPTAVWWLCKAWSEALAEQEQRLPLSSSRIANWGKMVSPEENPHGFRRLDVRVGVSLRPHWREVPERMAQWEKQLDAMTPEEAYREFEEIHPFRDGNGRTGKIIYNWLKGTLEHPVMPPNFWNCSNP